MDCRSHIFRTVAASEGGDEVTSESGQHRKHVVRLWYDTPHDGVQHVRARLACGHTVFLKIPASYGYIPDSLACEECERVKEASK